MSSSSDALAAELAALRRQIEALARRVEELVTARPAPAGPSAPTGEIPWLVIAAAVAHLVKEPHRIVQLQMPGLPPLNLWSIEGRRAVFHSHRVR